MAERGILIDELQEEIAAARAALVDALGSEGAVPLGGLAAGIRKLAEQRDGRSFPRYRVEDAPPGVVYEPIIDGPPPFPGDAPAARWDGPDWTVGGVGC